MRKSAILGCVLACLVASSFVAGCGGSSSAPAAKPAAGATTTAAAVTGLKAPIFEQPALITSIGQSADAQMVKALADRSQLKYKYDVAAKPEALSGKWKTSVTT